MIHSRFHYSNHDDTWAIERVQNVEPIVERNKREAREGVNDRGEFRKVASIPLVVVEKWKNELGVDVFNKDHMPRVAALLNSSEYAFLKATERTI